MTITLADLVSRLSADVPAVSGVPTAAQYEQAVKDAVSDLSRRASVPRVTTLAIVANQASYTVPADFQKLIRLAQIGVPFGSSYLDYGVYPGGPWDAYGYSGFQRGGVVVSPAGLVPFSDAYREQITVAGDMLTIHPTPQTSADRQLVYAAGDALVDESYPTLTEDRASIALLLAASSCLERIASSPGQAAVLIETGGDKVDFRQQHLALRTQATALRDQYLAGVASLTAAIGGLG